MLSQEEGLRVHMDGARLWNAAAALKVPLSRIVAGVDSVSVCYSKGKPAQYGKVCIHKKYLFWWLAIALSHAVYIFKRKVLLKCFFMIGGEQDPL